MIHLKKLLHALSLGLAAIALAPSALASAPTLPQMSRGQFEGVVRELSANSSLHSVTPPSSMGSIFGFEVGLIGGATSTPEMNNLVKQAAPGTTFKHMPHAGLLGAVTVPFGLTVEGVLFPETTISGVDYSSYAVALKWTLTDTFADLLPINIAVRGFYAGSEMSYSQNINNLATGKVKYSGNVTGVQLIASPKLIPVIEPYIGLGYLAANGKMDVDAPVGTLFDFTNGGQSAKHDPTSSQLLIGADFRLLLLGFGVEYSRAFDTDSYTAKFSLKF